METTGSNALYKSIEEEVDKQMIYIKDFARYHRYRLSDNDVIGAYKIKKLHNARYEKFHNDILTKYANKEGKIQAKKAGLLWIVYDEAREINSLNKMKDKLRPLVDKKIVDFWLKEFEKPIEELYIYGINTISSAYGIIIDYYRDWILREKYERVYSKGDTFDVWFEHADKNLSLMEGSETPFDMTGITEKSTILTQIRN